MKFLKSILIVGLIIFISCNRNRSKRTDFENRNADSICLLSLKYFHEEGVFIIPDHIDLLLSIKNSVTSDSISNILFGNIPRKSQELFVKSHHFKKMGDSLTLIVQTNYFNFDTLQKKSASEIEKILKSNVSLVIKNDTIPLALCN